jgi:hypothetical protein
MTAAATNRAVVNHQTLCSPCMGADGHSDRAEKRYPEPRTV